MPFDSQASLGYYPLLFELLNIFPAIAVFQEDFLRVLTKLGGGDSDSGRGLAELDRIGDYLNAAVGRVVKGDKGIIGSGLGVIDDFQQSLYRGKGYAFQAGLPLFQSPREENFIQDV
jgi:hypothetical protein